MEKSQVKSQSSLEYILIVALTFSIIIPATYLFYSYSKDSSQQIVDSQITQLGRNIVDTAEKIFYSGLGSKTVMDVSIPEGVTSAIIIDGRELVFNMTSTAGVSEIVFFSSVNLTTNPSNCNVNICKIPGLSDQGVKKIKLEASTKESVKMETI